MIKTVNNKYYNPTQLIILSHAKYSREKFHVECKSDSRFPVRNKYVKPSGGIWSSTYTPDCSTPSNWFDWCSSEQQDWLSKTGVLVTISSKTKIYQIDDISDLNWLLKNFLWTKGTTKPSPLRWRVHYNYLDFEKLSEHYDLIHLTLNGLYDCHYTESSDNKLTFGNLYGWDAESSLWLKGNIVKKYKKVRLDKYFA